MASSSRRSRSTSSAFSASKITRSSWPKYAEDATAIADRDLDVRLAHDHRTGEDRLSLPERAAHGLELLSRPRLETSVDHEAIELALAQLGGASRIRGHRPTSFLD